MGVGRNSLKVYLAFWRVPSESIFFFTGSGIFLHLWLEGISSFCPRFYFASSPGDLATVSINLVTPTAVLKLIFFIPISADEKGCYFRFGILANHLASFFFLHPIRRFVRTSITSKYVLIPSSLSIRSQSADISWLSFWPGFVTSAARNWPTFLFLFLTVNLWRPINSNTEGWGKFLISLLSVVDHVIVYSQSVCGYYLNLRSNSQR